MYIIGIPVNFISRVERESFLSSVLFLAGEGFGPSVPAELLRLDFACASPQRWESRVENQLRNAKVSYRDI